MLLLALDTSTSAITVALHDGTRSLATSTILDARHHAEHLAPSLLEVLAEAGRTPADVTEVCVGVGPGPFTGLRVGLVTARTFAFARGIPLYGVCGLDAMAHQAWTEGPDALGRSFVVATDARRKEVYWALYDVTKEGVRRTTGPAVDKPGELPPALAGLPTAGRGALIYPGFFGPRVGPLDVSATALAELAVRALAAGEPLSSPDPIYLRRPDAVPSVARKPVRS